MKQFIEDTVKALAEKSKKTAGASEAMQYSQAALNLAHAFSVLVTACNDMQLVMPGIVPMPKTEEEGNA